MLLPYGQIRHHSIRQLIRDAIYYELSIAGYSPQVVFENSSQKVSSPQLEANQAVNLLEITVKNLTLTAYDLLVTRRVVGTIDLNSKLILANKPPYSEIRIQESYGEFKSLPFKLQLERILEKLISRTMPCLLYTSPSPRDLSTSRMPSSA